jgi:hypothetical protein
MADSLDSIVLMVARRYGQAESGSATGGTTSSLVDVNRLWQPDNTYVGHFARITSGANAGQDRLITASTQAARSLTLDPVLDNAIVAGVTYQVLPRPRQDFVDAVQEAIRTAGNTWMIIRDDTTTLDFNEQQEYTLPADLVVLLDVFAGRDGYWYPCQGFEVVGSGAPYRLLLRQWPTLPYTQYDASITGDMRLVYLALPTLASASTDTLGVHSEAEREAVSYVQEYALHILHESGMARGITGEAARAHYSMAQQHLQKAQQIKGRAQPARVVRRIRERDVPRQI